MKEINPPSELRDYVHIQNQVQLHTWLMYRITCCVCIKPLLHLLPCHTAPNQLSLLHKAQELSYKLNTLQGSHNKLASTAAAQTPPGTEVQTQTFGVADQLSPQDCEDVQNALECSEHMVSRVLTSTVPWAPATITIYPYLQ